MHRQVFKGAPGDRPRSRSTHASRPQSRAGHLEEEDDLLTDINFDNLDEYISDRLNVLLNIDDDTGKKGQSDKQTVKLKLNSIPEIIKTLQKPKAEVSSNDRELLLNQLYNLTVKEPELEDTVYAEADYESDLLSLFKILQTAKSQNEQILANRAITAFIIGNIENSGVLYSEDKSLNILDLIGKKINDTTLSVKARQYFVYSYSSIALAIYDGTGGYGVDGMVEGLIETLIGLINEVSEFSENHQLIIALLYGIGALLTLLVENSSLNEIVENLLDSISDVFLEETENLEILKPLAMIYGLGFEIYQYDDDFNDDLDDYDPNDDVLIPYTNKYQIVNRLENLIKSSSKKISKKSKKEGRSLFKDVLSTINFYSDKRQRITKLTSKKQDGIELADDEVVLSHIKLSKSRSLAVKSWFAFFRLIQLKWVFSSGIHTQLANNKQIDDIVRDKPETSYASQFHDDDEEEIDWSDDLQKKLNHKRKQKQIETGRKEKLDVNLRESGVVDE